MSPLMAEWYQRAHEVAGLDRGDRVFAVEDTDPRVAFDRRLVSGAVVDGRAAKPGVMLIVLTSDGEAQELGVSTREQAENVIAALRHAWPGVGS